MVTPLLYLQGGRDPKKILMEAMPRRCPVSPIQEPGRETGCRPLKPQTHQHLANLGIILAGYISGGLYRPQYSDIGARVNSLAQGPHKLRINGDFIRKIHKIQRGQRVGDRLNKNVVVVPLGYHEVLLWLTREQIFGLDNSVTDSN
jgi:hypothetical protein